MVCKYFSVGCLFTLLIVSFAAQKFLSLMYSQPSVSPASPKIPESFKKQILNFLHADIYLHSIYILLGIISNLEMIWSIWEGRLIQDGGVEGCVLTPSCDSTGITTNCWTIIDRKTPELTKKDTPHPKTKEKLQWDSRRGAITINSNPIAAGWVTHKLENNYTTEVHPLEWRFWAPCQASQLGVWQWEEECPGNQTLKASGIWLQDFDRTGGNRDFTLEGHTQGTVHIGTQGEGAVTP